MKHIHIISPSGAIDNVLIDNAVTRLEQWGYAVTVAPHARGHNGRFAGTEQERLSDINCALCSTDTDIVLCSRGGYGLQQIADHIRIPGQHVPLVVGFSDITVLHSILGLHGLPTLHASMCKYIATLPDTHPALLLLQRALQGEKITYFIPPHTHQRTGECEGILIGGNLSVLYGLQGTPYSLSSLIDKCETPPILFIEDVCERHYHIDRMLQNHLTEWLKGYIGHSVSQRQAIEFFFSRAQRRLKRGQKSNQKDLHTLNEIALKIDEYADSFMNNAYLARIEK